MDVFKSYESGNIKGFETALDSYKSPTRIDGDQNTFKRNIIQQILIKPNSSADLYLGLVLRYGANPNYPTMSNGRGRYLGHFSNKFSSMNTIQFNMFKLLIEYGADVNYIKNVKSSTGTLLSTACIGEGSQYSVEVVKLLMRHGATLSDPFEHYNLGLITTLTVLHNIISPNHSLHGFKYSNNPGQSQEII